MEEVRVTLHNINAPELHETNGIAARDRLIELLSFEPLTIVTERDRTEKYGRWLGVITNSHGVDVGQVLLAEGLAVPYEGGRR